MFGVLGLLTNPDDTPVATTVFAMDDIVDDVSTQVTSLSLVFLLFLQKTRGSQWIHL
jgi:hypothetical protein